LHAEQLNKGAILEAGECQDADAHGQLKFNYRHPHIRDGQETEFLLKAFRRDFEVNGPSIVRLVRTTLQGWQRYKHHADQRIRKRFAWDARDLPFSYAGSLWAARSWFRSQPAMREKISQVLEDVYQEFGIKARLAAPLIGRYLRFMIGREERRLRRGWTYEPPTFYETNQEVLATEEGS
jgi:hypothetical protein